MIKSVFAATAALSLSAGAAFAGPYVNVEANSGWTGSDYSGTATDLHVGYEGELSESEGKIIIQQLFFQQTSQYSTGHDEDDDDEEEEEEDDDDDYHDDDEDEDDDEEDEDDE